MECDWQVRGSQSLSQHRPRHAVAVPASYGCSSDAGRSVWQSSSCRFACACYRDAKTVRQKSGKQRAKKREENGIKH